MKLTKIILNNYRSYLHEEIDFVDGLNTIVGTGGHGKSNLRKGIEFVTHNNQSGNIYSSWIVDKKGEIKKGESCWVELHLDTGDVIRRERTRTDNFYQINGGDPIRNFNQGVPDAVSNLLNLSEVNFQSQFESHYMLNDSSSARAKTLNEMGGLEIIDTSISNMNSIIRKIKKDKDASDSNLKKYTEELSKFNFLDNVEKDIKELEDLENERDNLIGEIEDLKDYYKLIVALSDDLSKINEVVVHKDKVMTLLKLYDEYDKEKEVNNDLLKYYSQIAELKSSLKLAKDMIANKTLVNELLKLYADKAEETKTYNDLIDSIEQIEELTEDVKKCNQMITFKKSVEEILSLYDEYDTLKKENKDLDNKYNEICDYKESLKVLDKEIEELYGKLEGEKCPVCGNPFKKGGCVDEDYM